MPMVLFHNFFPEVAENETRTLTLLRPRFSLPAGDYAFLELYCNERGCPCENALINVLNQSLGHVATINHSLGPGDAFADPQGPTTFLDPLNRQGPLANDLLALFEQIVCTPMFEARLRRHRAMVRAKVDGTAKSAACGGKGGLRGGQGARGLLNRHELRALRSRRRDPS